MVLLQLLMASAATAFISRSPVSSSTSTSVSVSTNMPRRNRNQPNRAFLGKDTSTTTRWLSPTTTSTTTDASSSDGSEFLDQTSTILTDAGEIMPPEGNKYYDEEQDEILVANADSLPIGSKEGFAVVHHFEFTGDENVDSGSSVYGPQQSQWEMVQQLLPAKDIQRLHLTPQNVTLPVALMMMDPTKFPTVSRARKFCRHGRILLHRGPLGSGDTAVFLPDRTSMGKVGDRVYPGDIIGRQVAVGKGYYSARQHKRAPPFELPVVFEDDHFAIVNKPPGVVIYSPKNAGQGLLTIKAALPHVLQPSKAGTLSALKRPKSVHRLDKPTSGLLIIGKTLPAMDSLSLQFRERIVKKTYTAVINGIPEEDPDAVISSKEAFELGVDVDPESGHIWQLIDSPLKNRKGEMRQAVTVWRVVRYANSTKARDGVLTQVELKPKTGRYHQLRQHMAFVCNRALVGDKEYDGNNPSAVKLRGRGLFLVSNEVTLEHPFYNTRAGRAIWNQLSESDKVFDEGKLWHSLENDTVMVSASIKLPQKFRSFLDRSEIVYQKYATVDEAP